MPRFYADPTEFKDYQQMIEFTRILESEWPTGWQDFDTVNSVYTDLIASSEFEESQPNIDDNIQPDGYKPRWVTVVIKNIDADESADAFTRSMFPRSVEYACTSMPNYVRVGFVFTDGEIPNHSDTEYDDTPTNAGEMWNINQTILGRLDLTVGFDLQYGTGEQCHSHTPGKLYLWNGNQMHRAPHTGFWVSSLAQVWMY